MNTEPDHQDLQGTTEPTGPNCATPTATPGCNTSICPTKTPVPTITRTPNCTPATCATATLVPTATPTACNTPNCTPPTATPTPGCNPANCPTITPTPGCSAGACPTPTPTPLAGRIVVHWNVDTTGAVVEQCITEDTVGDAALLACVNHLVAATRYPAPSTAATVSYPFLFTANPGC